MHSHGKFFSRYLIIIRTLSYLLCVVRLSLPWVDFMFWPNPWIGPNAYRRFGDWGRCLWTSPCSHCRKMDLQYKTHNAPPGADIPRGILGLGLHVYTLTISGRLYRAIFILGCICIDTYRYIYVYIYISSLHLGIRVELWYKLTIPRRG